ncbi:hypothetical protein C8Q78DRAFT_1066529 [Trametes maxima]|nr:hypothetical protein C8Q78DRAFT_1066529 [Trametes maxima]
MARKKHLRGVLGSTKSFIPKHMRDCTAEDIVLKRLVSSLPEFGTKHETPKTSSDQGTSSINAPKMLLSDGADEETEEEQEVEGSMGESEEDNDHNPNSPSARQSKFLKLYGKGAQRALYRRERPPTGHNDCTRCKTSITEQKEGFQYFYRCEDCILPSFLCHACVVSTHAHRLCDRLWRWDPPAGHWVGCTLPSLGYVLHLNHGGGECPHAHREPRQFVVMYDHGVLDLPVWFCVCTNAAPETDQLIEAGLWPATWHQPRTAMTISVMETYQLLSRQAQVAIDNFVRTLERKTDNVLPQTVKDRYREFNNASRQYDHVRRCAEYDAWVGEKCEPATLCLLCPACPQPGLNMRDGWQEHLPEYRYLDALHYSIDGNFHLSMKDRDTDPLDQAMADGASYFVSGLDFKTFIAQGKPSTCNQFGAIGQGKYKGKISGVVGISCRHMFMLPNGVVDLTRAEKYQYVDFALMSSMQRYLELLLLFGTYDINCQYMVNLRKRLEHYGVSVEDLESIHSLDLPTIIAGIGKYHLAMHKRDCRFKFSLHTLPGACMTDGEVLERVWAILNAVALRTMEMSAGHRHDVLEEFFEDMNVRRLHVIVDELCEKLEEGEERVHELQEYLARMEKSISRSFIEDWKEEERVYREAVVDMAKHKDLQNPYELPPEASITTKDIVEQLTMSELAAANQEGVGKVSVIKDAISIQERQRLLLVEVQRFNGTDRQCRSLSERVKAWHEEARRVVDDLDKVMRAGLEEAEKDIAEHERCIGFPYRDAQDDADLKLPTPPPALHHHRDTGGKRARARTALDDLAAQLESVHVVLPSSLHSRVRTHVAMMDLSRMERGIRAGQAEEALEELRVHLTTQLTLADRKAQVSGQKNNLPLDRRIHAKWQRIEDEKYAYRLARYRMRVLGMTAQNRKYRELKDADCKSFVVLDNEVRRGDSRRVPTWIWGNFGYMENLSAGQIKLFVTASVKVHWFRQRALFARWVEDVASRREEMYRTVLFLQRSVRIWSTRAQDHETVGCSDAAVFARRLVF